MNDAHFRNLDLNLLRVFQALYAEGSATQAGKRLGLTQSAISHALGRLRQSLNDELFLRGPSGLQATPRAAELAPAIIEALKMVERAVSQPLFDPALTERQFTIGTGSYVSWVLLPGVTRRFIAQAPRARLRVIGLDLSLAEQLDRGQMDMVISGFLQIPERFAYTPLFEETGVWAVRHDHPAAVDGLTLEAIARLQFLTTSHIEPSEQRAGSRDIALRRLTTWGDEYAPSGRHLDQTNAPIAVPDTFTTMNILANTDMAALVPRRLAKAALQRRKLAMVAPDPMPKPAEFGAVTRAGETETGPIAWLLGLFREAAAEI